MKEQPRLEPAPSRPWPGWCCSYCSAPLEERAHGLYCAAEGRWFATDRGVHRLLPDERRQELVPFVELERRALRDAAEASAASGGVEDQSLRRGLELLTLRLGPGPWRVLDAGAARCQASARLLEGGHRVVAVDVSVDADDGLLAADRLPRTDRLLRAEAEIEALPMEPRVFDFVVAMGSLHRVARVDRALVELRRVTRRGGALLVVATPVFRRRPDGEAAVAEHTKAQASRHGVAPPRETFAGYLLLGELTELFSGTGWTLEVQEWPTRPRELATDVWWTLRRRRRPPRYPILVARRDG